MRIAKSIGAVLCLIGPCVAGEIWGEKFFVWGVILALSVAIMAIVYALEKPQP